MDERELLAEATDKAGSMLIGVCEADEELATRHTGYIGKTWAEHMAATGIDLQTPLRDNMADTRPGWAIRQLLKVRKKVETVPGRFTRRQKALANQVIE